MRPVFQLRARGNSRNGWVFKMSSKKVFTIRESAAAFVPDFLALCTDPEQFEISILELELEEA